MENATTGVANINDGIDDVLTDVNGNVFTFLDRGLGDNFILGPGDNRIFTYISQYDGWEVVDATVTTSWTDTDVADGLGDANMAKIYGDGTTLASTQVQYITSRRACLIWIASHFLKALLTMCSLSVTELWCRHCRCRLRRLEKEQMKTSEFTSMKQLTLVMLIR